MLSLREDLGEHRVDAQFFRHGVRDGARVSGKHGDLNAPLMQCSIAARLSGDGMATARTASAAAARSK